MCSLQRITGATAAAVLAVSLGGCTGGRDSAQVDEPVASPPPTSAPTPTPTPTSTGAAPSMRERAAPYDVGYREVAGGVPRGKRKPFLRRITRPVRAWVDHGFVEGPWPRTRFRRALAPFTKRMTPVARGDARLLTLDALGPSLTEVIPERRRVRVSVSSPNDLVVGATAEVRLRLLGLTEDEERVRVRLRGELYLTRTSEAGWQIFGYDLDRWVEPDRGRDGAMTRGGGA